MDIATLLDALRDYKNAPKNWATSKTSKCLEKLQKIPSETSVCYRERERELLQAHRITAWDERTAGREGRCYGLVFIVSNENDSEGDKVSM